MKKLFLISLFLSVAFIAFAQSMSFLGHSLGGSIDEFQRCLAGEGIKYYSKSKSNKPGTMVFSGTVLNEKAYIYVHYNAQTKAVYNVLTVFKKDSQGELTSLKYRMVNYLVSYFGDDIIDHNEEENEIFYFIGSGSNPVGEVKVYTKINEDSYKENIADETERVNQLLQQNYERKNSSKKKKQEKYFTTSSQAGVDVSHNGVWSELSPIAASYKLYVEFINY